MFSREKPIRISGWTLRGTFVLVWFVRAFCLLLAFIAVATIHRAGMHRDSFVNCAIFGMIWIPFELWRLSVWCRGSWFRKTDQGFTVRTRFHEEEYRLEDIQKASCMTREIQPFFHGGEEFERRLTLVFPNRTLTMQTFLRPEQPDELGPFVAQVLEEQWVRAEKDLSDGNSISGQNWTLFPKHLTCLNKNINLDDIEAFEIVKRHLCIWEKGNDYPVLRIPVGSENVWILNQYLHENVFLKPYTVVDDLYKPGLGRFIGSFLAPLYPIIFCAITLIWVLGLVHAFRSGGDPWVPAAFYSLFYLMLLFVLSMYGKNWHIKVWERGYQCVHWFGVWSGFYGNVQSFSLVKNALYINGFYFVTERILTVTNQSGKTIRIRKDDRSANDGALDLLKDRFTKIIFSRYINQMKREGSVQWNDQIRIMKNGLEITNTSGVIKKKKETMFVPYEKLQMEHDANFHGLLLSWGGGKVFVSRSDTNFIPGLMLFEHCRIAHEADRRYT